jgi:hypothetical protein
MSSFFDVSFVSGRTPHPPCQSSLQNHFHEFCGAFEKARQLGLRVTLHCGKGFRLLSIFNNSYVI